MVPNKPVSFLSPADTCAREGVGVGSNLEERTGERGGERGGEGGKREVKERTGNTEREELGLGTECWTD